MHGLDKTTILLRLTGSPHWTAPDGRRQPLSRKDAALLALLAWDGPSPPERLATLLWPEAPPQRSRSSLRQRLFRLRRDTGAELATGQPLLALAPGVAHDLGAPDGEAAELLGTLDYGDGSELDAWVAQARRAWNARRVDALTGTAARHEAAGELAAALATTQRLVALAPLQEHAWRRLMRLHALRGDRAAALAAFEEMERGLRHELGARPSDETLQLLRQVEQAAQPVPLPRRVLPPALVRPPRLVGRAHELRAMAAAWDSGRAFMLVGEAGRGKSRLLDEFLAGHEALRLQARPGDDRVPYALAVRLLDRAVVRLADGALGAAERGELARLHPAFGTAPAHPGHQGALWHAVERLLLALRDGGTAALAVDDLQFADFASLDLLRWLAAAETLAPLRFAFATRPPAPGSALADWWADSTRPDPVPLGALSEWDVQALLESLALPEAVPSLAPALRRHAGGEPFHLLETLKDLVLHGAPADGLPRPASVAALLQRRLAALSAPAQALLRVAAIAGADFQVPLAAQVLGQPPLSLADAWAELEVQGVLVDCAFCHDLMREAALESLPAALRPPLHAAVALALQHAPGVPAGRRAEHWLAAGRWAEAGEALFEAGIAAHRAGLLAEHGALLRRAAEAFERAGETARRVDALCLALDSDLVRLGGQAVLDGLVPLWALPRTPRQQAELLQVQAEALLNLARPHEVLQGAAALRAASASFADLVPDTLSLHGRAHAEAGDAGAALPVLREAVAGAERLHAGGGSGEPLARALGHLGHACFAHGGLLAEGVRAMERAAGMALLLGDPADHAIHTANLATLQHAAGDVAAAARMAAAAASSYRRLNAADGDPALINELSLAIAEVHEGALAQALPRLRRAVQGLGASAPAAALCKARVLLAGLLELLDQPGEALVLLDPVAGRLDEAPAVFQALWHFQRARLRSAEGLAAALSAFARVPQLAVAAALLRDWSAVAPPEAALAELARQQALAVAAGSNGLQRTLRHLELAVHLRAGTACTALARALDDEAEAPLHSATPPWWAEALRLRVWAAEGDALRRRCGEARLQAWAGRAVQGLPPTLAAGLRRSLGRAVAAAVTTG